MGIHQHLPEGAVSAVSAALDSVLAANPGTSYTPAQLEPLVNPMIAWDAPPEALTQIIGALLRGRCDAGTVARDEDTGAYTPIATE